MSTISKKLVGFLYSGAAQTLASASWKTNVNAVYGITSAGTGYQVFKPGNTFNSLTQLAPDGFYILDAAKLGFDLPGATLTAVADGALTLDSFTQSFVGSYANISLQVSSPEPADRDYLLVFDSPGAESFKLVLGNTSSFSLFNLTSEQVVTLAAIAPSGARLTHTFTVGK